jgi:hypothetical protein
MSGRTNSIDRNQSDSRRTDAANATTAGGPPSTACSATTKPAGSVARRWA